MTKRRHRGRLNWPVPYEDVVEWKRALLKAQRTLPTHRTPIKKVIEQAEAVRQLIAPVLVDLISVTE